MSPSMIVVVCALLALTSPLVSATRHTLSTRQLTSCNPGCTNMLSTASNFGVLAYSTITNTGFTVVTGSLALSPGSQIVGFPPGVSTGTTHISDAPTVGAQSDARIGYNALVAMAYNASSDLSGTDLGGLTLTAGKYFFAKAAQLTGNLTLDAQGNPSAVFVIQTGTTFVTSVASNVILANGAQPCNVYYAVSAQGRLGLGRTGLGRAEHD
uniref:Ice-binding protein 1 n=1 Tax=Chloromonas brevispina TaxID=201318 RepID=A0A060L1E8_9CHLO|nr:ice-binding protein 1 [Chloromonas brevispina]